MVQLTNLAAFNGSHLDDAVSTEAGFAVEMSAISMEKTATPLEWISGELTYRISLKNVETEGDVTEGVITDTINPTLATLVDGSVMIDDDPAEEGTDYDFDTDGTLTINLQPIGPQETVDISFRVKKVL